MRLGCDTSTNGLGLAPTLAVACNEQPNNIANACSLFCHYTVLLMSRGDLRPPSPVICKSHEL